MTVSSNETCPAIFLDRDGTLMREVDYCGDPAQVEVFPGATDALRQLKRSGYKLIIITNQSGIARGYFNENDYRAVQREFLRQLGEDLIDDTYYCPDLPETNSPRRKPAPGMIFEAQRDHHLDLARSYFIGDETNDIGCGRNAVCERFSCKRDMGRGKLTAGLTGSCAISPMPRRSSWGANG
jgi:D-glycero-D-manno-heptose 1,7-bisphosphate phosphatase